MIYQDRMKLMSGRLAAARSALGSAPLASTPDQVAMVAMERQNDRQRQQMTELRRRLAARLDEMRVDGAQADQEVTETLTRSLAEVDERLRAFDAETKAMVEAQRAPSPAYYISGVRQSGMYSLEEGSSIEVKQALDRAQSWDDLERDKYVVIVRKQPVEGKRTVIVAAHDIKDARQSLFVYPGDVVMVTTRASLPLSPEERYYFSDGTAAKTGFRPIPKNLNLLQALVADGVNPPEMMNWSVVWSRPVKQGEPANTRQIFLSDVLTGAVGQELIQPGDTLEVNRPLTDN